jgi:branched-chain amino acid transport system ATP-binding protein
MGLARTFQHGRVFGNLSVLDNVLVGAHVRLRAVRPAVSVVGPLLELALAAIRPSAVRAEEEVMREKAKRILSIFGERLPPGRTATPRHRSWCGRSCFASPGSAPASS